MSSYEIISEAILDQLPLQELAALLSDIRLFTHELRKEIGNNDRFEVKYLPPLRVEESELGELALSYTGNEFDPQPLTSSKQINDIWGFSAPPHRLQNSLPRYIGYIAISHSSVSRVRELATKINSAKDQFQIKTNVLISTLCEAIPNMKKKRITDLLIATEIIDNTENYELIIRKIITTGDYEVNEVMTTWAANTSQNSKAEPAKIVIKNLNEDDVDDLLVIEAIKSFEIHHPGSRYCVRYTPPPQPQIRFTHPPEEGVKGKRKVTNQRFSNASPLLVLNWNASTKFNPLIERVETELVNGRITLKRKREDSVKSAVRLIESMSWFAIVKKSDEEEK